MSAVAYSPEELAVIYERRARERAAVERRWQERRAEAERASLRARSLLERMTDGARARWLASARDRVARALLARAPSVENDGMTAALPDGPSNNTVPVWPPSVVHGRRAEHGVHHPSTCGCRRCSLEPWE